MKKKRGLYLYVAENKSVAGREGRFEGDALGRHLAVAWFEHLEERDDGIVVRRADRSSPGGLNTLLCTIAELLHAAGEPYPALGAAATSRDQEVAMEARFGVVPRLHYDCKHLWEEDDPWTFILSSPAPAEGKYLAETAIDDLTNMALARQLELLSGTDKRAAWATPRRDLLAQLAAL